MFCTACGAGVQETAAFCGACGARVKHSDPAPAPAPAAPAPDAPVVHIPASSGKQVACEWCGAIVDAAQLSCPRCGATLQAKPISTESGWAKLPGRRDMAKLQFGDSFCQIEGLYVPVADVNLAGPDSVYFAHHVLLWKDPQVAVTTLPLSGGWKRMFAGLPLVMTQAHGPGHIAFSCDAPGEMIALPIQPGQTMDVREHLFMVATGNVAYDWFQTNIWYSTQNGNETETHYPVGMFMDRFSAPQAPGLLLLHAAGNVFVRELGASQPILVKPTALIFKDPTVQMQLHFERPRTGFSLWGSWGNRYMWLRLWGPGRVAVQSVFEPVEGENRNINRCSAATERQW
ncbi:MAG TPA: AIM24 family protein [Bryobacteraceae bacterium]|nr:AIM24 family protein [Bryobacteraceae bacterium]